MNDSDQVKYISYGQYCPLAMASEILCNRWTVLVLRELLFGSSTFNDISRGVPRMSRTLLSKRLKELVQIGVITKQSNLKGNQINYQLTEAGEALEPVIIGMAGWGQEWLQTAPSLEDLDPRFLMWDIMRNAQNIEILPNPFITHIHLSDIEEGLNDYWLVFENDAVDLCNKDNDYDVDVQIIVDSKVLTSVWMGWDDFESAVQSKQLKIMGDHQYTSVAKDWLGQSIVSGIKKRPESKRINY
ncbi:helix-turn-helix domain-containing protein [Marinicella sp. S1101]|uniref:winged helix-turn-helix transcriptional regulator n=1 Tax=Marinicella marina TaxID=2996016 RepID=UPI002260F7D8|nr:helix-turn-helix domain-containing protein [Marinicella marina]MCX7554824.1 helix-turn-helix domain-containing protein [Marinicella marina]MDJ1140943.1 helix-turn-helix domain-containing protein [Marinicella marina]